MFPKKNTVEIACLAVMLTVTSADASIVFTEDFENYIGRTADLAPHYFSNDPNYASSGWGDYYQFTSLADQLIIIAAGGPHGGSHSGYDPITDSQGITNMNANTPPHGHALSLGVLAGGAPANTPVPHTYSGLHWASNGSSAAR